MHLAGREAHDWLAVLDDSKNASLHNVERVTGLPLGNDFGLSRKGDLLEDVAELAAGSMGQLLQQRHSPQCLKAPGMPQLLKVPKQRGEGLSRQAQ